MRPTRSPLASTRPATAALLDLEAARPEHAPVVQALIQRVEIGVQGARHPQPLRADVDAARAIRHRGAAGVVMARAGAQDAAQQLHLACAWRQRHGSQAARVVLLGRQIDHRASLLPDAALAAFQDQVAAPAIARHVVESDSAAGHVQLRRAAQHHAVAALQRQLAAGQHDGAVHAHIGARQAQFRAQFLHGCRLRARQRRHADVAPGRDLVHGPRQTGQQRRVQVEIPAAVSVAAAAGIRALRFIYRQAATVIGRDAFAGVQVDAGKAQGQAAVIVQPAGLRALAVAELDAFGLDAQHTVARAGPAGRHRPRRLRVAP
ncbi:hypothetical protein G6F35_011283 [Rhizopus arrhizus]|nr:hypothetical protein G6F35_011283 [Rhizopus arrhizus]